MAGFRTGFLKVMGTVACSFSLRHLISWSGQKLILPVYHLVSDDQVPHVQNLYPVKSIKDFTDDLDLLLHYYEPIDLEQLIRHVRGDQPLRKPAFHLTFDDGLQEFYSVIAPILKEKGVPATNFLNSAFIDNHDLFYRYKISLIRERLKSQKNPEMLREIADLLDLRTPDFPVINEKLDRLNQKDLEIIHPIASRLEIDYDKFLAEYRPYLTSKQVRELISGGFSFGAHSVDHPQYRLLSLQEQIEQTQRSVDLVCSTFDIKYRCFAFPFTDFGISRAFFHHFFRQEPQLDLSFGSAGIKEDLYPQHLQRIPMETQFLKGKQILHGEYLYYLLKDPFGKNHIRRA